MQMVVPWPYDYLLSMFLLSCQDLKHQGPSGISPFPLPWLGLDRGLSLHSCARFHRTKHEQSPLLPFASAIADEYASFTL